MAAGVPGAVAGLAEAHARFGSRPWRELVEPSVSLARDGFRWRPVDVAHFAEAQKERQIERFPSTAAIFYPDGKPLAVGAVVQQPELAKTLQRIATNGGNEFYEGTTARLIVDAMKKNGGIISARDLREYKPTWRAPIRIDYRDYEIFTMAPPSAGGLLLGEMLQILEAYDLESFGHQTPLALHLLAEVARRAYLDRNRYLGDPATTRIPYAAIFSPERASGWRSSIDLTRATPTASLVPESPGAKPGETTHFSIVDQQGNIASVTTTINTFFGNGYVVPGAGFLLNNEMDDFTTAPGTPTAYGLIQSDANAIGPSRKMASSMTPTIIFRQDEPFLVLGSPGGGTIPTTVLQVFLNVTTYGMRIGEAIAAPRFHHQAWPDRILFEEGRAGLELLSTLNQLGHATRGETSIGDVHALMFKDGKIYAAADARRGGLAGGF